MNRLLLLVMLLVGAVGAGPAAAQTGEAGLPPRPTPFKFVNDQASLMEPADAKKLDSGLRRYADNTGTQIVVVTVPSLGSRTVADYARALGTAWGVGQRDKNNGIVVLLGAQEHKISIQPGSGMQSAITPEVTSRVINEMTPDFKQNNYFAGFRKGLNTLMATANPNSVKDATANNAAATTGAAAASENPSDNMSAETQQYPTTGNDPVTTTPVEPAPSGPGMGTLLIGALVIGGILWFVVRMFKGRAAANNSNPNGTPNFLPNRPNGPTGGNNYGQNPGNYGPGYGQAPNSGGGMGVGGMLATGAAAAAGAYLGNRMASGHDTSGNSMTNDNNGGGFGGAAAGAAGAASSSAGSDYFSSRDGGSGSADNSAPDYFSDANTAPDNSNDFFSSDDNNSSYDDNSSGDTGGGGFDSTNDNSGSW
ncbi:TPM domain-containing protein [Hymenobacter cyanobacteriorum]|uniref:TPM domain-containing protein n=1 Tax=Hymenobacter cyanobacteriorum TaxID=2926463 RepID=UPI0024111A06|nr:TPM domain-containing protein [Hymenobacter cyanobacteriorum]